MQRPAKTGRCLIFFACCLAAGPLAIGQAVKTAPVPAYPRKLKFQPLRFMPSKASAYRQVFKNGAAGFFVEDHDLPLVNVSILVRAGTYLDPATMIYPK
jgi:hypothetical protein